MSGEGSDAWVEVTGRAGETQRLGTRLAAVLRPGDVVLLVGELGTGKTCFAQGLALGMGIEVQVTSPTFTLLREYPGELPLYHLDAYRLEGPADLFDMGMEEYMEGDGVLLVEWADRARGFFDVDHLEIVFEFGVGDDERRISIMPRGGSWVERLGRLRREGGDDERD
jgi:tRNA threonylcarbamoyladenosine biosynthesis protein TsaE